MSLSLVPARVFSSYAAVTPEYLADRGVRLLLSDLDFTLAPKSCPAPDEAVRALRTEFFADTVPIAVGEKQGIRRKPAPDTLLTAMVQLGAERTSTVYVGDSEVDIATARAAGLPCISVLWGFRDRDVLEQAGAQQFAADTGELARLLD